MKFPATFKHLRIYVGCLLVISLGAAAEGFLIHENFLVAIAACVPAYLCSVRLMRSITITDTKLEFSGIIKRWSADWQDIEYIKRVCDYDWPLDRWDPHTYVIQTTQGRRIVGFLFFPGSCLAELQKRTKQRRRSKRTR